MKSNFSLTETKLTPDGKYVLKTGLIFRAGNYEDKNFSMTPEELLAAEAEFEPVPIDVEHVDNLGILEGKLGSLEAVYSSDDAEELYGTAKIPVWLNELNKDENGNDLPFKVSSTLDRKDKKIKRLAIVKNPRVSDAALMAAFTADTISKNPEDAAAVSQFFTWFVENEKIKFKDQTYDGRWAMQNVHDQMARSGAVCTKPPKDSKAKMAVEEQEKAQFVSKEESAAIQKMHDLAISNGAVCSFYDEKWALYTQDDEPSSDTNIGRNNTMKNLKEFFGFVKNMSDEEVEKLNTEFSGVDDDDEKKALKAKVAELTSQLESNAKTAVEETVKNSEDVVDHEKEELKKQVAELKRRNLESDAEKFAEGYINANKIKPASKEIAIALFMQASDDDESITANEVKFSDDKSVSSRSELLKALFDSLDEHNLSTEELAAKTPKILNFSKKEEAQEDITSTVEEARALAAAYATKRNSTTKK